ncbi:hypothetical protein HDV00_008824 [Rhizophlyctis rosea]|nr:hypothetical protein HDV00_008824 [Rhizophlyctis rosea]
MRVCSSNSQTQLPAAVQTSLSCRYARRLPGDPNRIKSVRTLCFDLCNSATVLSKFSLFKALVISDLNRLQHFSIGSGELVDQTIPDVVAVAFIKAASQDRPLQLQTFKFSGKDVTLTCIFVRFLRLLERCPLRELVLDFHTTYFDPYGRGMWDPVAALTPSVVFGSLKSLRITSCIVFIDLAVSLPSLTSIDIWSVDKRPLPPLETLTQPSLTTFKWEGTRWPEALSFIPKLTQNRLTSVSICCTDSDEYFDTFNSEGYFQLLSELVSLRSFTLSGFHHPFECKDIGPILQHLPEKVEKLHLTIPRWARRWVYEEVRAGLGTRTGLKEVRFVTQRDVSLENQDVEKLLDEEARRLEREVQIPRVYIEAVEKVVDEERHAE